MAVVGAGAAGLAATRRLMDQGFEVVLLEAGDRIGGRAWTDRRIFGVPFDIGAHWLHHGRGNPFNGYGRRHGFDIYRVPENYRLFAGEKEASAEEMAASLESREALYRAIGRAGGAGLDISAAEAAEGLEGGWASTAAFALGPWSMGKDLADFSSVDWWNAPDSVDWLCRRGYGALLAHAGAGLPASLGHKVERIDWGGPGVSVETRAGAVRARAAVVTVSTGVLAAGDIAFAPHLPERKRAAFEGMSMGHYNHVALRFSRDIFELGEDGYLLHRVGADGRAFGVLTNSGGTGIAYCDVGGRFARELEDDPEAVAIDFVKERLRAMLGSEVDRRLVKAAATRWGGNPLTRGAYASAEPGAYRLRRALGEPVAERLFFAGEACHSTLWASVDGAHLSGLATADEVAATLRRRGAAAAPEPFVRPALRASPTGA